MEVEDLMEMRRELWRELSPAERQAMVKDAVQRFMLWRERKRRSEHKGMQALGPVAELGFNSRG